MTHGTGTGAMLCGLINSLLCGSFSGGRSAEFVAGTALERGVELGSGAASWQANGWSLAFRCNCYLTLKN